MLKNKNVKQKIDPITLRCFEKVLRNAGSKEIKQKKSCKPPGISFVVMPEACAWQSKVCGKAW